jgi:hypothetical protein
MIISILSLGVSTAEKKCGFTKHTHLTCGEKYMAYREGKKEQEQARNREAQENSTDDGADILIRTQKLHYRPIATVFNMA